MGLKIGGWALLGALLLGSGFVALFDAPGRAPAPGPETASWLAARSLAADGDLRFVAEDSDRYRQSFGESPRGVEGETLTAPPLAARAWAAAARVAPARGPHLLNWLVWSGTLLLAAWLLTPTLGETTPWWIAFLGYGSAAFASVFHLQPELLAMAAVVAAAALVWGRPSRRNEEPEQIYAGELERDPVVWRWPLAGLALGAAAIRSPVYLLLALPMAIDLPRPRRGLAAIFLVAGLALPPLFVAAVSGLPWEAPAGVFTPALAGWNFLYALVGASAGAFVWFAPILLILAFARRRKDGGDGRAWLPHAVLAALVLQLLLQPFDWTGDRWMAGNPHLLPLYAALWFALDPKAGVARRALPAAVLLALAATPWLLPFWLHPATRTPATPSALKTAFAPVRRLPLFETTLREVPGALELRRGGARLLTIDPAIAPEAGRLVWSGAPAATVVVESDRPLASVRFELGDRAPSTLDVSGGKAGDTTFSPAGEVAFDVQLSEPARRHPLWWSREPVSIYFLRLSLPQTPPMAIPFDLRLVRPVEAEKDGA